MAALNVAITPIPQTIAVGQQQPFHAAVTNLSGEPLVIPVTWTFGDGQGAAGIDTAHVYMTTGIFKVVAVADDQHGRSGQAETMVSVQ